MQGRDRTIERVASAGLAAMIDEYTIFGPKLGDRLPSFLGISLSEHFVEIAFDESLYRVRHSSLPMVSVGNLHGSARSNPRFRIGVGIDQRAGSEA